MENSFIEKTIQYFLDKLSVKANLEGVRELHDGDMLKFAITTEEPYLLIGHDGKTLMALNYLVKKIVEQEVVKNNISSVNFIIDVNDYQEKKIEEIKNKANMMAERARFFKSDVEMMPMNPYERMIIHSIFTGADDINTESVGKGRERRVVIKYTDN